MELRPRLWRWTAAHPAWRPGAEWPPEVGCVYYETPEAILLIDPLVPADEEDRFWRAFDRDVERAGVPVLVVLTAPWHARSSEEFVRRFDGRIAVPWDLPQVEAFPVPPVAEGQVALFLREHGALVTAEILADLGAGLAVCPSPALRDARLLSPFLQRLVELPLELIVPAHGAPVLERAREVLAAAVAHAPSAA